jgi:ubiquinone/menaquinone biosynthesis C-methylase UbiE
MIAEALKVSAAAGLRDRVHFIQADLADLPYEDDTFDLIASSLSLHHWQDIPAVMHGLARVLRPGGRLLVYDATVRVPIEDFNAAAADAFPGAPVSRTLLKRRWFPIPLLQRLSIDTDESHAVRNHTKLVTAT